jgi:hypothetical protein
MTFWSRTLTTALLIGVWAQPLSAQDTVWTAVIPKGFPGTLYTWHLKPDGSYSEDGHDMQTGAAVQPTLSGHWRVTGKHMVLKQDGMDFLFDGDMIGGEYLGVLYLDGKRFARFCAMRGTAPPQTCADVSV